MCRSMTVQQHGLDDSGYLRAFKAFWKSAGRCSGMACLGCDCLSELWDCLLELSRGLSDCTAAAASL